MLTLCVSFLALPSGLAAKERRGADLLVTRIDGAVIAGELIAVRPDALVLLISSGADVSVGSAEIASVRIVRPSKIGKAALWGGLGSALSGGALLGYLAGQLTGGDPSFTLAGRQEADVARSWARLKALSREGALSKISAPRESRPELPPVTERLTEVSLPAHSLKGSTAFVGLRIAARI